ncbi:hypothetical protein Tco_1091021 [Tanacetum coccineum]|uniref:Uncharacterized protein n=1 Tax=Tanacetum coccineum TaxID=301880 RepID=A0ABQ5I603_9ASTR
MSGLIDSPSPSTGQSFGNVNAVFSQFEVRIAFAKILDLSFIGNTLKFLKLEAEISKQNRNLDAQINIMKVLSVGSTEGSCDQQALETDRIQLKDMITSLRIQLDGLKVENLNNVCAACNKSFVIANHTDCLVMCDGSVNVKPHQTKRFNANYTTAGKNGNPIKSLETPLANLLLIATSWMPTGKAFLII